MRRAGLASERRTSGKEGWLERLVFIDANNTARDPPEERTPGPVPIFPRVTPFAPSAALSCMILEAHVRCADRPGRRRQW